MTVKPFRSACFFSVNNGATVQRRTSAANEESVPIPTNPTNLFRFDETQPNNAAILQAWDDDSTLFSMQGNTVYRKLSPTAEPQAIGFDPPGLLYTALENAADLWDKVNRGEALDGEEQAWHVALTFRANGLLV